MNTVVFYGSMREGREGIKLAKYICTLLEERNHTVTFVDALELNLPILSKRYSDYKPGEAPKVLEDLADLYKKADGFILIAGEYNHSVQPGLKNLLDYFFKEYFYKPSGLVTYSISTTAGARAGGHWRVITAALGMSSIPMILSVPQIQNNFDLEGKLLNNEEIAKNSKKFLDQFEWYEEALRNQRNGKGILN